MPNNERKTGNGALMRRFMPYLAKYKGVLCFDMFLGRLEIFPMLILFAPDTWKR